MPPPPAVPLAAPTHTPPVRRTRHQPRGFDYLGMLAALLVGAIALLVTRKLGASGANGCADGVDSGAADELCGL